MASFVKSKVKAARDAIGKKDFASAENAALQALEYEPDNYNAYVRVRRCTEVPQIGHPALAMSFLV